MRGGRGKRRGGRRNCQNQTLDRVLYETGRRGPYPLRLRDLRDHRQKRKRFSGEAIIDSIALMHDRSNGLGGGFAGYGIYPEYADFYAFHIFYDSEQAKIACEEFLHRNFSLTGAGEIPTRLNRGVKDAP